MKKINWTEIAIAAPTALVFANLGGIQTMFTISLLLATSMILTRVLAVKKSAVVPVMLKRN